ncbi:uncharacterized protein OCT59_020338 [Rhizophagus irregularis]|nr:hypothetical protein OCT59_020338 [Rhizophagus irregularis]
MTNEYFSEEIPFNDTPHDEYLAVQICKGLRPKIFEGTPRFFADLIMKCWDAKVENRPTAKELYEILKKWNEIQYKDNKIHSQMKKYEEIRKSKLENRLNISENLKIHPQAIYTSRFLNFKNLPELVNSSDLLSFQINLAYSFRMF